MNNYKCKDGSEVLTFTTDGNYVDIYIHYVPEVLPNGNYEFFKKLSPSYNVSYNEDGSIEIPLCINNTGDYRFALKVEFSMSNGKVEINKKTFTFLNNEDKEFNDMFAKLDYKTDYCLSLAPLNNLTDEDSAEFLRACVFNGNMNVLDELYKLIPNDDLESKYSLELAGSIADESGITLSNENPYKPEIFYDEKCKDFPQNDTLTIVAKSMQAGKSIIELGAEEVESNFDWKSVKQIPNSASSLGYVYEDEEIQKVYKLDLDKDGLMEILIFFPGGTMGNEFWEILHLDKSGLITDTNSGDGMSGMSLYRYNEDYFFLSNIRDFNDKEFLGWTVYALSKKGDIYGADIWFEIIGSEIVFSNQISETEDYYSLDWSLNDYIDKYKRYEYEAIGTEITPSKEVQALFHSVDESNGKFGVFDINNDNINDWTEADMFFPSNQYCYYCNYRFIDGKTNQLLDFSKIYDKQAFSLGYIIPYSSNDKNYFVSVLNGYGNYIIKLFEIKGIEPIELENWFLSSRKRILIDVFENSDSSFVLR
jgi:hypothetical protein